MSRVLGVKPWYFFISFIFMKTDQSLYYSCKFLHYKKILLASLKSQTYYFKHHQIIHKRVQLGSCRKPLSMRAHVSACFHIIIIHFSHVPILIVSIGQLYSYSLFWIKLLILINILHIYLIYIHVGSISMLEFWIKNITFIP